MPLSGVGHPGFSQVPAESQPQTPAHTAGGASTRAEQRPSDIPPSPASHIGGSADAKADIAQLRSVPKAEQTQVQRLATQATAEKPSFLRRLFTGLVGGLSGAFGGIGAGLYATGGALKVTMDLFQGALPLAAVAGFCVAVFGGAALLAAGIVGGAVAGTVHGAREGTFGAAINSATIPVDFVADFTSSGSAKNSSKT